MPWMKSITSGRFRVIYYVQFADHVILLTIYSKTEQTDISSDKIREILENIESVDDNKNDDI